MHLLLPIIVIGIEIAYYGQRLPILVLWLQKLLVSYCYWYWYCRFAEDGSEIDVGIAKDKSLLLVLILLLFSEAIKYWYWYWYCTPEAKSIDIDIELKFLLSHTPVSHGVIRFAASVSSKNHLLTGWNSLTANQGASI